MREKEAVLQSHKEAESKRYKRFHQRTLIQLSHMCLTTIVHRDQTRLLERLLQDFTEMWLTLTTRRVLTGEVPPLQGKKRLNKAVKRRWLIRKVWEIQIN